MAKYLKNLFYENNWKVVGPAQVNCKSWEKFRWQILIHGPECSNNPLPDRFVIWNLIPKNVFLSIDVNPIELY